MTKPQLTRKDGSAATQFNSTNNTVAPESVNRDMNLFHFGIPLTTLSENVPYRTPFTTISITGIFIGGNEAALNLFIDEIEGIATVNQEQSTYTNGLGRETQVKINNFTYNIFSNTNRVEYTLQFYDESI